MHTKSLYILATTLLISLLAMGCSSSSDAENGGAENGGAETSDSDTNGETDGSWQAPEIDEEERKPLLLIGVDGVKPSYLEEGFASTPNFDRLADDGVLAESLKPVFPSHTFPNLYSIVTGLYPGNHGIVGNTVYDPDRDETLSMRDNEAQTDPAWWGGEPIWATVETQGLRAGTFFWVGSEAKIGGVEPTHYVSYNSMIPHNARTDQVANWLTDDDEPVDFATLYFASPDGAGHEHGPEAPEVVNAIEGVDHQLGRLINQLESRGLWPDINVIILSDHGMIELDEDKVIFLDDIIDLRDVDVVEWSPVAMINPEPGKSDAVYDALKAEEDNFSVYRREDLPDRYNLNSHPRVADIVVIADLPYSLGSRYFHSQQGLFSGGHGFDPEYPEMHGFFLAHGPDFPAGERTDTLKLVDIYALMTHLLVLEPAEHDGSLERIGTQIFGE